MRIVPAWAILKGGHCRDMSYDLSMIEWRFAFWSILIHSDRADGRTLYKGNATRPQPLMWGSGLVRHGIWASSRMTIVGRSIHSKQRIKSWSKLSTEAAVTCDCRGVQRQPRTQSPRIAFFQIRKPLSRSLSSYISWSAFLNTLSDGLSPTSVKGLCTQNW